MPATKKKEIEATDYPAWWDWSDDGDIVDGTFIGMDKGFTAHGERVFVTLEVDGNERTIWLHWEALRNQFAREIHRRPDKTIHRGEHVVVRRLGERTSGNGREYFDFKVEFPDGPATSQADLLGMPDTPSEPAAAVDQPASASGSSEDEIPF